MPSPRHFEEFGREFIAGRYLITPIVRGKKNPVFDDWQARPIRDEEQFARAIKRCGDCGIGIVTGEAIAVDIDVLDREVVDEILLWCDENIGRAPLRVGKEPKSLLLFRSAEPLTKMASLAYRPPGEQGSKGQRIEVLADGQQFVAYGYHPETGGEFIWPEEGENPRLIPLAQLPTIEREQILSLFDFFEGRMRQLQWQQASLGRIGERPPSTTDADDPLMRVPRPPESKAEVDRVRSMLGALDAGMSHDQGWRDVLFALHWTGWECARELAEEWSKTSSRYSKKGFETCWRSAKERGRRDTITLGTLVEMARRAGWTPSWAYWDVDEEDDQEGNADALASDETPGGDPDDPDLPEGRESTGKDWLDKLNERYAQVRVGGDVLVADTKAEVVLGERVVKTTCTMSASAFTAYLKGQYAPRRKANENPRQLAQAYLENPRRLKFEGIGCFPPPASCPDGFLNLWSGFAVAPRRGDVSLWLRVLDAVVPDPHVRQYVLHWLAWKVQNPGAVPGTILIVMGLKGIGKNSLFDPLVEAFGRHAMVADNPELIAGRFTGHLMDKVFVVLDEAVFTQDPRQADAIKSRVTAKTMMFEDKGMKPISGVNRAAFVSLTNHSHVWQATVDERRAVVVKGGDALRGAREFWNSYFAWVESGAAAPAVLDYLRSLDLSGFEVRDIPRTGDLDEQIQLTALRDPVVAWWAECLAAGELVDCGAPWGDVKLSSDESTRVLRSVVRESFLRSTTRRRKEPARFDEVSKRLRQWTPGMRDIRPRVDGRPERMFVFPALAEMRDSFTRATRVSIEGADDE